MKWIYQLIWWGAIAAAACVYPFVWLFDREKADWFVSRLRPKPIPAPPDLWIHAVSIGELKLAFNLMEGWSEPQRNRTLMTTTTPAGWRYLRARHSLSRYLPFDLMHCYRRMFGAHRIPTAMIIETELWPNMLSLAAHEGCDVIIVNGRLSARSSPLARWSLLSHIDVIGCVCARHRQDEQAFVALGVQEKRIVVTGNMKYDFKTPVLDEGPLKSWLEKHRSSLILFASISSDEVRSLADQLKSILERFPEQRFLWAPRHLETVKRHIKELSFINTVRRSTMDGTADPQMVILDSFGELAGCYPYGRLSVVGGSFNKRGGQNFLESIQAGTPAIIGPSFANFKEEVTLARDAGALMVVERVEELAAWVCHLLEDPAELQAMERSAGFLNAHRGAVTRTLEALQNRGVPVLDNAHAPSSSYAE